MAGLVGHLDTFARDAHDRMVVNPPQKTIWKSAGEYLGVSFAESNPRKYIKRSKKPLGHLPLEILNHLSAYVDSCVANGTMTTQHQSQASEFLLVPIHYHSRPNRASYYDQCIQRGVDRHGTCA